MIRFRFGANQSAPPMGKVVPYWSATVSPRETANRACRHGSPTTTPPKSRQRWLNGAALGLSSDSSRSRTFGRRERLRTGSIDRSRIGSRICHGGKLGSWVQALRRLFESRRLRPFPCVSLPVPTPASRPSRSSWVARGAPENRDLRAAEPSVSRGSKSQRPIASPTVTPGAKAQVSKPISTDAE